MVDHIADGEEEVNLVADLSEGRLTYIASMARQLSLMARAEHQAHLTVLLDLAADMAQERMEKILGKSKSSIVNCASAVIRVKP